MSVTFLYSPFYQFSTLMHGYIVLQIYLRKNKYYIYIYKELNRIHNSKFLQFIRRIEYGEVDPVCCTDLISAVSKQHRFVKIKPFFQQNNIHVLSSESLIYGENTPNTSLATRRMFNTHKGRQVTFTAVRKFSAAKRKETVVSKSASSQAHSKLHSSLGVKLKQTRGGVADLGRG